MSEWNKHQWEVKRCLRTDQRKDWWVCEKWKWLGDHLEQMDLGLLKYDPLRASSYIQLPEKLVKKKACVNVRNVEDEKCFLWSILASLRPVEVNPDRLTNYIEYEREVNMRDINYPVKVKDLLKFEKQNPRLSVNVFGLDDDKVFPLQITERKDAEHHVNLLMISDDEKSHYVWIKNFSRLVSSQTSKHKEKKWYCYHCLQGFGRKDLLDKHNALCRVRFKTFFSYVWDV